MACNSKVNTINHLKEIGVLDEVGLVTDTSRLDKINQHYLDYVNNDLGIKTTEVLLPYREVKNKRPDGHITYKYVLEPNTKLFEQIDNVIEQVVEEDIDFDMPASSGPVMVLPQFEKMIQYRESLARAIEKRLEKVKVEKRKNSGNTVRLKELTTIQNVLETRLEGSHELSIDGLRAEITALKTAPAINRLEAMADADFARLNALIASNNPEDIKEAYKIIEAYEAIGTFDPTTVHPIFNETRTTIVNGQPVTHYINTGFDENTGEVIVPQDIQDLFASWKERVQIPRNKLYLQSKGLFTEQINSNRKVQKMYEDPLTYEELTHKGEGLGDANWVDMFFMDTTNGIFSTNGIIPQVMMNTLQNSFQKHLVYAKDVEERIDSIKDRLETALKSLKASHGLDFDLAGKSGVFGLKGVSYDLFQAKDKNGFNKDGIVQRYDSAYTDERNKMLNTFRVEMENAYATPDPVRRDQLIAGAHNKRRNWFKKHTVVLDIRKMPEIAAPGQYQYTTAEQDAYKQELIDILGETGYEEELAKQQKKITEYESMLEVVKDAIAAEGGTTAEQNAKVQKWANKNNPFSTVNSYYENPSVGIGETPSMSYNYAVPRRKRANMTMVNGVLTPVQTTFDTGYYDKRFEIIEGNKTLKEFHELLMEVQQKMFDTMPPEVRKKFNATSLPTLMKNLIEILSDPNITFFQKVSKAARYMYDKIRAMFGINIQSALSYAEVNPITGKSEYKVSSEFLQSNKEEINQRYQVELLRLKQALGIPITQKFSQYTTFNLNSLPQEALNVIAESLGVDASVPAIMAVLPKEHSQMLEVGKILRSGITDQVVKEKSFDLPKVLKLYSYMTMEYAARQEVLPALEMMKGHYEEIKKPETTNTGVTVTNANTKETSLEGERINANRQMESWFNRAVLGNYGSKNELGNPTLKRHIPLALTNSQRITKFTSALSTTLTGRILSTDEKIMQEKIQSLLESVEAELQRPGITAQEMAKATALHTRLLQQERELGKDFAFTAFFDAIFNFIRFKGLGWNLSSYITNYAEGQIANMIVDASGDYFTSGNIHRANHIVKGSFLKNMTGGKVATKGAKLTRVLMDRYKILQDATNQLQKASAKSAFSQLNILSPYAGTHRTEYLNQAPLMLAVLMDQKIIGADGTESSVLDAMNEDGTLKENFSTGPHGQANIDNWEKANGPAFQDFSSHIIKTIVNTHGDYDELRGNMASENISGKAFLMFKRWMARQFYQRFARVEQPDLEVGIKNYKGRYFSHTKASGLVHGAIIGFSGFGLLGVGPVGLLVGGAAGYLTGAGYGTTSGIGFLRELAFNTKHLFLTLVGLPLNYIAGKAVIKPMDARSIGLQERDARNYQANMIDMSIQLMWTGLTLFVKSLLWDDDDDTDDDRRKAHNFLVNRFMQLSSQAAMYSNPLEIKRTLTDLPIIKFFGDIQKLLMEAQDFVEGDDILASGPNAGESALFNQTKKTFFPGIIKGGLGFETAMRRQFNPHGFDAWFHSDERKAKKVTQGIRAGELQKQIQEGLTKEEAKKKVKKKYRNKKRGDKETYQELLDYYEGID